MLLFPAIHFDYESREYTTENDNNYLCTIFYVNLQDNIPFTLKYNRDLHSLKLYDFNFLVAFLGKLVNNFQNTLHSVFTTIHLLFNAGVTNNIYLRLPRALFTCTTTLLPKKIFNHTKIAFSLQIHVTTHTQKMWVRLVGGFRMKDCHGVSYAPLELKRRGALSIQQLYAQLMAVLSNCAFVNEYGNIYQKYLQFSYLWGNIGIVFIWKKSIYTKIRVHMMISLKIFTMLVVYTYNTKTLAELFAHKQKCSQWNCQQKVSYASRRYLL